VAEADEKTPPAAGISSFEPLDVARLFARLKDEVRQGGPRHAGRVDAVAFRVSARAQAERLWPVSAERPLAGRPGWRGAAARPLKVVLRRLMRWYVEPLAADQRAFNDALLKLVDDLQEQLDDLRAEVARSRPEPRA
jgi:hypothetical protein